MPNTRLVYSTDQENTCSVCHKPLRKCSCQSNAAVIESATDGIVRLQLERKGRGGKQVTTISGLLKDPSSSKALIKQMKTLCGTGGSVKGSILEIQGDHREKIKNHLEQQGYKIKISGA